MARFDSAIALAKRLIDKNGQQVILRNIVAAAPADSAKPWEPGENTNSDQDVFGVFLDYEQKYIDGSVIRMGDQQVYLYSIDILGNSIIPEVDGQIIRDGDPWDIKAIRPLNPNGQSIMFTVQVRQ